VFFTVLNGVLSTVLNGFHFKVLNEFLSAALKGHLLSRHNLAFGKVGCICDQAMQVIINEIALQASKNYSVIPYQSHGKYCLGHHQQARFTT